MSRILTITMEATDEEFANLLARVAIRGVAQVDGLDGDDEPASGETVADPNTLDKAGVPWLESVHASTKGQTKDGLWRGKKGVSPEQRAAAENEWKAKSASAAPMPAGLPAAPAAAMPTGLPGAMPMPAATMPMPEPEKPVAYQDVIDRYLALSQSGKMDEQRIAAIYNKLGIGANPSVLMSDETKRREIMKEFDAIG